MKLRRGRPSTDDAPAKREVVTTGNAKKAIAVGKILVPVLAPIAMQAAAVARGAWDDRRARRLGVAPSELGTYSGKGGALHARISGVAASMRALAAGQSGGSGAKGGQVARFVADTEPRLADLSAAVRAAELMPTERRRAAHRAVSGELDRIEPQLLGLLGVGSQHNSSENGSSAARKPPH